ncbi:Tat (twin-arginine translocation) pathway signal sequence [Loktanella atrilutea]|uniref:Tat (Twin-arginine translocation) pathway signal sequence n=1 Tax=Loktanella atrilutea TaxID=366533 RepID=A0A1M4T338_LOKAT|nr:MBL fold metallo-hydrolase [Loktanella atrilutea]SHE38952.1 Tat (twin-arginine translocation) pathway signal sequence [Loktanella atrilutea]
MTTTRRHFLATSAAAAGAVTLLPYAASAEAHASDMFPTNAGDVTVHPVEHASFVMETPVGTIYNDPVGDASLYADYPAPDLILITHEHGDHYNADTLAAIAGENTQIIANPAVYAMLPEDLKTKASEIGNGGSASYNGLTIDAIPAYNTTEGRLQNHPKGRDNGYVLTFDGLRVYISGDTEDIPEMRALENIDVAFICMNLPYTMDKEAAASAVAEFKPTYVYPYHYRGEDGGTQNPEEFAALVGDAAEVRIGNWYGDQVMPS